MDLLSQEVPQMVPLEERRRIVAVNRIFHLYEFVLCPKVHLVFGEEAFHNPISGLDQRDKSLQRRSSIATPFSTICARRCLVCSPRFSFFSLASNCASSLVFVAS